MKKIYVLLLPIIFILISCSRADSLTFSFYDEEIDNINASVVIAKTNVDNDEPLHKSYNSEDKICYRLIERKTSETDFIYEQIVIKDFQIQKLLKNTLITLIEFYKSESNKYLVKQELIKTNNTNILHLELINGETLSKKDLEINNEDYYEGDLNLVSKLLNFLNPLGYINSKERIEKFYVDDFISIINFWKHFMPSNGRYILSNNVKETFTYNDKGRDTLRFSADLYCMRGSDEVIPYTTYDRSFAVTAKKLDLVNSSNIYKIEKNDKDRYIIGNEGNGLYRFIFNAGLEFSVSLKYWNNNYDKYIFKITNISKINYNDEEKNYFDLYLNSDIVVNVISNSDNKEYFIVKKL